MSQIYMISDVHFGHKNITKYRPMFSSAEEHDNVIFDNIMTKVKKRDILWMLGDTCFSEDRFWMIERIKDAVAALNYIPGNHDTDNTVRQAMYKEMIKRDFFNLTGSMFKFKEFWLTHPPMHPSELYRKINIHGHTHNKLMLDSSGKVDDKYINVCVEHTNFSPVSLKQIRESVL